MASSLRATTAFLVGQIFRPPLPMPRVLVYLPIRRRISLSAVRCSAESGEGKKAPSRMSQVQQLMAEAQQRAASAGDGPIPKITLDHVTVNFARSGGPGGQNVNKVNTKVDMRFNVQNAYWLSERVREKIMQMEKNRINKDGELVISSTKTRTQKLASAPCLLGIISFCIIKQTGFIVVFFYRGNIDDALEKLQAIIDAASYVPPPPSEEQVKKIAKLAAIGERKRLESKKALSQKKAFRRSKESWD